MNKIRLISDKEKALEMLQVIRFEAQKHGFEIEHDANSGEATLYNPYEFYTIGWDSSGYWMAFSNQSEKKFADLVNLDALKLSLILDHVNFE